MAMLDSYLYSTEMVWTGRRAGIARAEALPDLKISAPPEFSGDPGQWTPEHLLVAAVSSCLMTTFLAIAEISKLAVASYESHALARLEKVPGEGYRFTEITLTPEIGVAAEDFEKAQKVLAKAEKNCFISNSLRTTVQVEPRFRAVAAELAR
jgi:peroxiredoxin-like protein